jgi:hypothetical protein
MVWLLSKQYSAAPAENVTYRWDSTTNGKNGKGRRLAGLVVNFMPTTPGDFAAADRKDSEQNALISRGRSGEVHTLFGRERPLCVFGRWVKPFELLGIFWWAL